MIDARVGRELRGRLPLSIRRPGHEHRRHAKGRRRRQVSRDIVEQNRGIGVDVVAFQQLPVTLGIGLGDVAGVGDIEDAGEKALHSKPLQDNLRVVPGTVGEDHLAPLEAAEGVFQGRIRGHDGNVDLVHVLEEGFRVEAVVEHEPAERRAEGMEIVFLQPPRRRVIEAQEVGDEVPHAPVDLGEQRAVGRIERVVEIEHPLGDVKEGRAIGTGPGARAPRRRGRAAPLPIGAGFRGASPHRRADARHRHRRECGPACAP